VKDKIENYFARKFKRRDAEGVGWKKIGRGGGEHREKKDSKGMTTVSGHSVFNQAKATSIFTRTYGLGYVSVRRIKKTREGFQVGGNGPSKRAESKTGGIPVDSGVSPLRGRTQI